MQQLAPVAKPLPSVNGNNNASKAGAISTVYMGSSQNVLTLYLMQVNLYAEPAINTITKVYRGDTNNGDPGSGYIYYSKSTDGGLTFTTHMQVYAGTGDTTAPFYSARFPQGLIYNPPGNTNPDSAYFTYFCPGVDTNTGAWEAYETGTVSMAGGAPTQTEFLTNQHSNIPTGFCVLQGGSTTYGVDVNIDTNSLFYNHQLLLYKGTWNGSDFNYTEQFVPAPVAVTSGGLPAVVGTTTKIAFGPDGLTGYICLTGHLDWNIVADSNYAPIIYKTTDGGNT
jgi:hypothetical protein